jgi:5-methylthioadenosine/S-adenosylhomocysteine deaminase
MRIHARWLLPVSGPPVRDGTVIVDGRSITYVGPRQGAPTGSTDLDLGDAILLPGLVNAHIHLDLGALEGKLASRDFFAWMRELMGHLGALPTDALREGARRSVVEQLAMGVTTMADTAPHRFGFDALREFGARGIAYREVFGPDPAQCADSLAGLQGAVDDMRADETDLVRVGVSPHAPFSVADALYTAVAEYARAADLPIAVHIAESVAETELVRDADGPFARYLRDVRGIAVTPRGASPIAVLERTGILAQRPLCIHAVQVAPDDVARLAAARAPVAHCPCSNRWFGHGAAPIAAYRRAGITVGLGTDSIASNTQVQLAVEAAHIADPSLTAADRIALLTQGGAAALGLADRIGVLRAGWEADLAAFPIVDAQAADTDPERYLLDHALTAAARFVMVAGRDRTGGRWVTNA